MNRTAEVIVVGLGAMGSATCWQLAARGVSVLGFDRHAPPHAYGSSHGETRITRLAIGEGSEYVPFVRRSHELWREIEQRAGTELMTQTGGLVLGRADSPFLAETRAAARTHGIEHESLTGAEIAARFPMFAVDEATEAYYEPEAGFVRPEAAVRAQLQLARAAGARLHPDEAVEEWGESNGRIWVRTRAGRYEGEHLVLCAGAWIPQLFPEARHLFAVHRQVLYWFPIRRGYEQLRDMPVFIWDVAGPTEGFGHLSGFYGFPAVDGPAGGVKLATESYDVTTTPDAPRQAPTPEEVTGMVEHRVAPFLPWLGTEPLRTTPCLYTSTPESRFVIDRHPEHDAVLVVSPCSGHGFKHSAGIGEVVAQQVMTGASDIDLVPFRLPALS